MAVRKILSNIYEVGAIDWNRRLFDELIPLHKGTSYNSYAVIGKDKTALIDTVDPTMLHVLLNNLRNLNISHLDYIISHHAEQDHSGSIPKILEIYPEAVLVTNAKCKAMPKELLLIPDDKFLVVEDRQVLSLGDVSLEFINFPWVHWPETFITYSKEKKILFSCDLFGSHLADSRLIIDGGREGEVKEGAFRYFAEIMYPFRDNISSNLQKILDLDLNFIAPSHGGVYSKPEFIIDCYKEWISPDVKNKVVIPYISMHESTHAMVNYLIDILIDKGIEVKPYQLNVTDIGELAMDITDAATVIVGTPQVLGGMHPSVAYAVYLFNLLRPKTRFVGIIGSYGWGGKMIEQIQNMLYNLKAEVLDPVVAKGFPKTADFEALDRLAEQIKSRHNGLNK